jgi:tetratricopeptide (TPR) repeat protein
MYKSLFALLFCVVALAAQAKEYGVYDGKLVLVESQTSAGKRFSIDAAYLDRMLGDLASHAINYPPQFDSASDMQRATADIRMLAKMLDVLFAAENVHPELLYRGGLVNSMGHNLKLAGSAEKAVALYERLLKLQPDNTRANLSYGRFLAGAGKPREGLPFLEKALSLGAAEAGYSVGLAYLFIGDRAKAITYLENYKSRFPADPTTDKILEAIRTGKIVEQKPG